MSAETVGDHVSGTATGSISSGSPDATGFRQFCAELGASLGIPDGGIGPDDDLFSLGLDSLRLMTLRSGWRRRGVSVDLVALAEDPTPRAWWRLVQAAVPDDGPARPAPGGPAPADAPVPDVDPAAPFALTAVQQAYWIGRGDGQPLGGVGCHAYLEFDGAGVDPGRLTRAVRALVARHGMLRARFPGDGTQIIGAPGGEPPVRVVDLAGASGGADHAETERLRATLSHRRLDAGSGEVLAVTLCLLPDGRTRLIVEVDFLVADVLGLRNLLADLATAYRTDTPDALRPLEVDFPTCLARRAGTDEDRTTAAAYWAERLEQLPAGPRLPLATDPATVLEPRFVRRSTRLSAQDWETVQERCRAAGLTPAVALATAYAEVLAAWSDEPRFLLNLPVFDRDEFHPDVMSVVADFTGLMLLEVDCTRPRPFLERAREVQARLRRDLAHASYSGVEVLRDLTRIGDGRPASAPVVFASALGGDLVKDDFRATFGELGWMVSQTPQVWLDNQVVELAGGLYVSWDAVEELFPAGVLDAMFAAYERLLAELVGGDWARPLTVGPPAAQLEVRAVANATAPVPGPLADGATLHAGLFDRARREPGRVAVRGCSERADQGGASAGPGQVAPLSAGSVRSGGRRSGAVVRPPRSVGVSVGGEPGGSLSYGELAGRALRVAGHLVGAGVRPGDAVAVSLPRGVDQVVAVFGVLAAGGVYVPVSPDLPESRRDRMRELAGAVLVLDAEKFEVAGTADPLAEPVAVDPQASAYVIFTSGTTGDPKGVEVTHAAAMNTIVDVVARFGVGAEDRVLTVSALDFDLSVFDLFGLLSVGGSLVLTAPEQRRDAAAWAGLVREHGVTVWNTVPALADMLLVAAGADRLESLRTVLVSGDWVGLDLAPRLAEAAPDARLIALGGATEAAIWSNHQEVPAVLPPEWTAVPYGRPLAHQRFRVVDPHGQDRPDHVVGELWIGGAGVAVGYRGDADLTAAKFVEVAGERWYRTGDLGRYWPDGTLEFLGRADTQVKIRGHRIELGEIDAALQAAPAVAAAVTVACGDRGRRRLVAFVVPADGHVPADGTDAGITDRLRRVLPDHAVPARIVTVDALPLTGNGKVDRRTLETLAEHQDLPESGVAPAGAVEERVAALWAELLDLPAVARDDSFFVLGGDSVVATRMVARLAQDGIIGGGLGPLFATPTLAGFCAGLVLDPGTAGSTIVPDPAARHEPFPMTDVQRAYQVGRRPDLVLGGVGTHYYGELDLPEADVAAWERAWNTVIARHDMLRAVVDDEGTQRVLAEVPRFTVPVTRGADALDAMREQMSHRVFDPACWPLFEARAVHYERDGETRTRLGIGLDNIVLDAASVMQLFGELDTLVTNPDAELPTPGITFRDYVQGTLVHGDTGALERAREHWRGRIADGTLPPAPALPLAVAPAEIEVPRFTRRAATIAPENWAAVRAQAARIGVTPSAVLLACYAEVLSRWSGARALTVNLTLFDRRPVHPDIDRVLGDFTSLLLVTYRAEPGDSWAERVRRLQEQLWRDLDHREASAVWVMRELARARDRSEVGMPVVFTSALGLAQHVTPDTAQAFPDRVWGVSQTPQVWLDQQAYEFADGRLFFNWDAVEQLFAGELLDDMFSAYTGLLSDLAGIDWSAPVPAALPAGQRAVRAAADATPPVPGPLDPAAALHTGLFAQALAAPGRVALRGTPGGDLTYGELAGRALRIAGHLARHGVRPGDAVAVSLPKGADQIAAVFGVLAAGGVYVPVSPDLPEPRRDRMRELAGAVLTVDADGFGTAIAADPLAGPVAVDPRLAADLDGGRNDFEEGEL